METLIMDKTEQNTISFKQRRKYNVNDCFFETPNIVNCYYAGFIAADGCIRKYKGKFVETYSLSFGLSIKDKDFLTKNIYPGLMLMKVKVKFLIKPIA